MLSAAAFRWLDLPDGRRQAPLHTRVRKGATSPELFPICNVLPARLCANVRAAKSSGVTMTVIDFERDRSADFSDLYARLLNAALDERNSSLSPNLREYYLTIHVARVISMSDIASEAIRNPGLEHDETKLL
jgi:hypothetical protein